MLTERALGVDKRVQQRFVAACQSDKRLVYCRISVRIKTHRLTYDVGALGFCAGEQSHLVHGIQQLSVCGLEAVYLGYCTGDYDTHCIRHEVFLNRFGDRLLPNLCSGLCNRRSRCLFLWHNSYYLFVDFSSFAAEPVLSALNMRRFFRFKERGC